ncbi:hypothetical protein ES703_111502 [subsurface metagenome]
MLNFTEHMKRIIELAEQTLVHVQDDKINPAAADLMGISNHATEAMQQLDEFSLLKHQGKDPAKRL